MTSNLFFPDNAGRYNRVIQLDNNIATLKGLCAQSYDQISRSEDHIDKIREEFMKQHGFKTIDEYAQSIANILPDEDRKAFLHLIKTFKDADDLFAKSSSVLTAIAGTAGGLLLVSGSSKKLIEVLSEGLFRAEFARGFRLFVKGEIKEGYRVMKGVTKWARNHYEFLGELAPALKTARVVRVLRVFNSVLEFVAKWAFIIDIAVLWMQFNVEAEQREQLRKGIHDYFCQRFNIQMQYDQFKATQELYVLWHGFTQTKLVLDKAVGMPEESKKQTLNALGESWMTTHQKNLDTITDDSVWKECEVYDNSVSSGVYKDEDPSKEEVKRWLEEQAKKKPEDIPDAVPAKK